VYSSDSSSLEEPNTLNPRFDILYNEMIYIYLHILFIYMKVFKLISWYFNIVKYKHGVIVRD